MVDFQTGPIGHRAQNHAMAAQKNGIVLAVAHILNTMETYVMAITKNLEAAEIPFVQVGNIYAFHCKKKQK